MLHLYYFNDMRFVDDKKIMCIKYFTFHRVDWIDKLYRAVGNLASQFTHSSWKSLLFDSVVLIACVSVIRPFINQRTLFVIYSRPAWIAPGQGQLILIEIF